MFRYFHKDGLGILSVIPLFMSFVRNEVSRFSSVALGFEYFFIRAGFEELLRKLLRLERLTSILSIETGEDYSGVAAFDS